MLVQTISETLFHLPGVPQYKKSPDITEQDDHQGNSEDDQGLDQKCSRGGCPDCQKIDGPSDDQGDQELKEVHCQETRKPSGQGPAVLNEIWFEREEIFECFSKRPAVVFHRARNTGAKHEMSSRHKSESRM